VRDWPPKRTQKTPILSLKKKTEALRFYATMAAISSNGLFLVCGLFGFSWFLTTKLICLELVAQSGAGCVPCMPDALFVCF
jgi:hypothetical protein